MLRACASLFVIIFVTGCITFNGKELKQVRPAKLDAPTAVIALELGDLKKTLNGDDGGLANLNETLAVKSAASQIPRFWKAFGLVKEWGYPGELDEPPTHRLVVNGTVDEAGSLLGAFLTGATLYLVPNVSTITSDLSVRLERLEGDEVEASFEASAKNSIDLWQWIVFAPTSVLGSIAWGSYGAQRDSALFLYDDLRKQGAFEASVSAAGDPTPTAR